MWKSSVTGLEVTVVKETPHRHSYTASQNSNYQNASTNSGEEPFFLTKFSRAAKQAAETGENVVDGVLIATTELSCGILPHIACWDSPLYHGDTLKIGHFFILCAIGSTDYTHPYGCFFSACSGIIIETPLYNPCESVQSVDASVLPCPLIWPISSTDFTDHHGCLSTLSSGILMETRLHNPCESVSSVDQSQSVSSGPLIWPISSTDFTDHHRCLSTLSSSIFMETPLDNPCHPWTSHNLCNPWMHACHSVH